MFLGKFLIFIFKNLLNVLDIKFCKVILVFWCLLVEFEIYLSVIFFKLGCFFLNVFIYWLVIFNWKFLLVLLICLNLYDLDKWFKWL